MAAARTQFELAAQSLDAGVRQVAFAALRR